MLLTSRSEVVGPLAGSIFPCGRWATLPATYADRIVATLHQLPQCLLIAVPGGLFFYGSDLHDVADQIVQFALRQTFLVVPRHRRVATAVDAPHPFPGERMENSIVRLKHKREVILSADNSGPALSIAIHNTC